MSLIKSISGIRGTIGGPAGDGLTPLDIVKFTAAYAKFIASTTAKTNKTIVVGRDARLSGGMVRDLVVGTLTGMGFDVVDIGLASTPTTELAVTGENACGGLILTASHNPIQWNALKLLNEKANSSMPKKAHKCSAWQQKRISLCRCSRTRSRLLEHHLCTPPHRAGARSTDCRRRRNCKSQFYGCCRCRQLCRRYHRARTA